jgi:hypothetical protein
MPLVAIFQSKNLPDSQPLPALRIASAHISKDTWYIICLTSPRAIPGQLLVDRLAQLTKQLDTEEGTPRTDRDHRIGPLNIGPLDWQCAQPSPRVQIRHAVTTPVVAYSNGVEGLTPQRMERVSDGENLRYTIATVCNARFSIRGKSSVASGTPRTHL